MKVKALAELLTQMSNVPEVAEADVIIHEHGMNVEVHHLEFITGEGMLLKAE